MSLDQVVYKLYEVLVVFLVEDMGCVNDLIVVCMVSEYVFCILEVIVYLVGVGGKWLWFLLILVMVQFCGYNGFYYVYLVVMVEFIYMVMFLYDDVVDESVQCWGCLMVNLLWDNKSLVLVGDYLFLCVFQLMVEIGLLWVLDIFVNVFVMIVEGEVLQLMVVQDLVMDESIYLQVVCGKMVVLFFVVIEVGGVIVGVDEVYVKVLFDYGDVLGIVFQIVDDFLDYQGDSVVIGKNVGDDFCECKLILLLIKVVVKVDVEECVFWECIIEKGKQVDGDLEIVFDLLYCYGVLDEMCQDVLKWVQDVKDVLVDFLDYEIKILLIDFVDYVVVWIS